MEGCLYRAISAGRKSLVMKMETVCRKPSLALSQFSALIMSCE